MEGELQSMCDKEALIYDSMHFQFMPHFVITVGIVIYHELPQNPHSYLNLGSSILYTCMYSQKWTSADLTHDNHYCWLTCSYKLTLHARNIYLHRYCLPCAQIQSCSFKSVSVHF